MDKKGHQNLLSITTPPLARLIQQRGYLLSPTIEVMKQLYQESIVDGFEFQNMAEWDATGPPLDKAMYNFRIKNWETCEKHTIDELASVLNRSKVPILSVHANRDIGILICSNKAKDNARGEKLIHQSLSLAKKVHSKVCVFHIWNTWKEHFDPLHLKNTLYGIADEYPSVKATVENVPTRLKDHTAFDIVKEFDWITLDLRWAAMYNELDRFDIVKKKIVNIHVRSRLEDGNWELHNSPFTLEYAFKKFRKEWKYPGLFTVEPEGGLKNANWTNFSAAMSALRLMM